jgi:Arc/MetJ family transcription regulator
MRTTIRIDDDLLSEAKKMAAESKKSLTALIEDALREVLSRKSGEKYSYPVKLTTFKGNGLQRGVDLDDSASLLDTMGS